MLSRDAVNEVLLKMNGFISNWFVPFIQLQMKTELNETTNALTYNKVHFVLEKNKNLFDRFSTKYRRFKIYEEESLYRPPEKFPIGNETIFVARADC